MGWSALKYIIETLHDPNIHAYLLFFGFLFLFNFYCLLHQRHFVRCVHIEYNGNDGNTEQLKHPPTNLRRKGVINLYSIHLHISYFRSYGRTCSILYSRCRYKFIFEKSIIRNLEYVLYCIKSMHGCRAS